MTASVFPFHVGMPAASWKATGQYDEVRTCTNTESPFNQPLRMRLFWAYCRLTLPNR